METSKNLDPSWDLLIKDLQGYGISRDVVVENRDFVEGFLAGSKVGKEKTVISETNVAKKNDDSDKRTYYPLRFLLCSTLMLLPFTTAAPAGGKKRLFRRKTGHSNI